MKTHRLVLWPNHDLCLAQSLLALSNNQRRCLWQIQLDTCARKGIITRVAWAFIIPNLDFAMVGIDNPVYDRQPKPGARCAGGEERIEHSFDDLLGDAVALIAD